MKTLSLCGFSTLIVVSFTGVLNAVGEEPTVASQEAQSAAQVAEASNPAAAPAPTAATERKLPYGVDDILKLSKAQINEEVILTYMNNSGVIYSLAPKDIIYLRDQGVSDRVVNNMIEQRAVASQTAAQASPAPIQSQPAYSDPEPVASYIQPTVFEQPSPLCVQPSVIETQPASTLFVIPYPARTAAYYGYPQYYRNNYGYCGPTSYGYCGSSSVIRIGVRGGRYCSR